MHMPDDTLVALSIPHVHTDVMGQHALLHAWSLVLAGRESSVPPLLGCHEDPLETALESTPTPPEPWTLASQQMGTLGLILLGIRMLWTTLWSGPSATKTIYIPASFMQRLTTLARKDVPTNDKENCSSIHHHLRHPNNLPHPNPLHLPPFPRLNPSPWPPPSTPVSVSPHYNRSRTLHLQHGSLILHPLHRGRDVHATLGTPRAQGTPDFNEPSNRTPTPSPPKTHQTKLQHYKGPNSRHSPLWEIYCRAGSVYGLESGGEFLWRVGSLGLLLYIVRGKRTDPPDGRKGRFLQERFCITTLARGR